MKRLVCILFAALVLGILAPQAEARTVRQMTYQYGQLWSTTIRFLRVDSGFPITEQDKKSGYVLFQYTEAGKNRQGSVELVPMVNEQRHYVRLGLRIQGMPSYLEVVLLDRLKQKLKDEYGDPPPARVVVQKLDKSAQQDKGDSAKGGSTSDESHGAKKDAEADEPDLEQSEEE